MTNLADALNPKSPNSVEAIINRAFSELEAKITEAFAEASQHFGPNDSFQSTTNSVPYPSGATPIGNDPLNPNAMNSAHASNGTHVNYVQTHTNNYANQGGTFPPLTSGGGPNTDSTFQSFTDTVNQNTGDGTSFQTDSTSFLGTLQSVFASRQSFYDTIMIDLIDAAKDVVLDVLKFVDKMIQDLLSLAFDAIGGFQAMLSKGIDIPVISWIWKQISHHSLTMLDLFSLVVAVPATLLYKLTFGMPGVTAPFTDDQAQQIVAGLNNPQTFPWPILGSGTAPVSASAFTSDAGPSPFTPEIILIMQKVLIAPAADAFMGADVFNDVVGWVNVQDVASSVHGLGLKQTGPYAAGSKIIGGLLLRFALTPPPVLKGTPISTELDKWSLGNWAAGFTPLICLLVLALRPVPKRGFGMTVASVVGCLQLGVGIATDVEQAKLGSKVPYTIARNVIGPLANIPKCALWIVKEEPYNLIALGVVAGIDFLCDLAVGALALCAVVK